MQSLKEITLFNGLSEDELAILEQSANKKLFPRNTILVSEGDTTDSLYVICSGKVKVIINDDEGREVILSVLGAGDYFGEMALLDNEPRSACVMTKEPTEIMMISKQSFMEIFSSHPVAYNLLTGLTRRLREANKKIESLALLDVYGRIARLFAQLAMDHEDGSQKLEKLTHQEIANMIGSSREMVSIILKELVNGNFISIDKQNITINKKLPYSW
jgi:CRP/FNR family cyclic AMP-dependent transcriptional regulator